MNFHHPTLHLEYEKDFHGWIEKHISLLKTGQVDDLDSNRSVPLRHFAPSP
jgi:hypothetical protein